MRLPQEDWQPMPSGYRNDALQTWKAWQQATAGARKHRTLLYMGGE